MVEFVEDRPQGVFHGEEIGDAGGLVQRAGDFGGDAVIMAVERLAGAVFQKNESGRQIKPACRRRRKSNAA